MVEKQKTETLSVVIPVYNGDGTLKDLVARLEKVLPDLASAYEIILVNDGSRDRSWEIIGELADACQTVRGINLMRNYGQHNALLCGIRSAQYGVIVTIDDDLQHPPEEIPKVLDKLAQGYDVVYGTPAQAEHNVLRNMASRLTKLALQNAMGTEIAQNISAFRAFRTHVRKAFANYQSSFVSIDVLLTWGTVRFAAVRVNHEPRPVGVSNYTVRQLIRHAFNMITGFSVMPLQLASLIGFVFSLFGIGVLTYVVGRFLIQGSPVPGFPFLASVIAIFAGAQLFALGIIGEYLARMHFRMMERPIYAVSSSTPPKKHEQTKQSTV